MIGLEWAHMWARWDSGAFWNTLLVSGCSCGGPHSAHVKNFA
jgi:hypothetical protein